MNQIIRLKRTLIVANPPSSLEEGELAVGLNDDPVSFWIGTPGGVKRLFGFLPLSGGQMTPLGAAGGTGIEITNDSDASTSAAFTIVNEGRSYLAQGIYIMNRGEGAGISVNTTTSTGTGIYCVNSNGHGIRNEALGSAAGILAQSIQGSADAVNILSRTGTGLRLDHQGRGAGQTGLLIDSTGPNTGPSFRINIDNSDDTGEVTAFGDAILVGRTSGGPSGGRLLKFPQDGTLEIGQPTGPAVTGRGKINVEDGYYINGVKIGGGGGGVEVSPTAPADPSPNMLWFNEAEGHLYLRLQDAWVQVGSDRAGPPGPPGVEGPPGPPGEPGESGGAGPGVTDGSEAASGEVGEFLEFTGVPTAMTNAVPASLGTFRIPPGDWDINGDIVTGGQGGNITRFLATLYIDGLMDQRPMNPAFLATGGAFTGVWNFQWPLSSIRLNTAIEVGYEVRFNFGFTGASGPVYAHLLLRARRMR